eukprot:tig00000459_g1104.t1
MPHNSAMHMHHDHSTGGGDGDAYGSRPPPFQGQIADHDIALFYRPAGSPAEACHVREICKLSGAGPEPDLYGRLLDHACNVTGIPACEMRLKDERWRLLKPEDFVWPAVLRIHKIIVGRDGDKFRERIQTIPSTKLYRNMTKDLNFAFALMELIDNSVEATKANFGKDRGIEIRINLRRRVIEIADNGWGMSEEEIRKFAKLGDSQHITKHVSADIRDKDEQYKYFMNSELSRYGVGAKSAMFYLGSVVRVNSKVQDSDRINHVQISLLEMEGTQKHEANFESTESLLDNERAAGSFTHIEIRDVPTERLEEYIQNREDVHRFLAEVYHFYLYGGFKRDPRRPVEELGEAFTPIDLSIDEDDESGRKSRRYDFGPPRPAPEAAAEQDEKPYELCRLAESALRNEVRRLHEAFFPARPELEPVAGPSSQAAAADDREERQIKQGDKALIWERPIEVPVKDEATKVERTIPVQLAVAYFPVQRNKETMPPDMPPGLTVVWQGRCMPSLALGASKQSAVRLAFMDRPKYSKDAALPPECWKRFKGFLFVSGAVEPTCHKTQMAITEAYTALCNMDPKSPLFKELHKEFRDRMKAWHALDDEVSAAREGAPFTLDDRTVVREVEWVALGKNKYRAQDQVRVKFNGQLHVGTVLKCFVYDDEFRQKKNIVDEPFIYFRKLAVDNSGIKWAVPVTCITGTVKDKEWNELRKALELQLAKGVRFVDHDEFIEKRMPKEMSGDESLVYVAAEVYNFEEDAAKQRVKGAAINKAVPHLWLVLYLSKKDANVGVAAYKKLVKADDSIKAIPEELRTMRAPWKKDGKPGSSKDADEFIAMKVLKVSANSNDAGRNLFYLKGIEPRHRGLWKFRLVPVRQAASGQLTILSVPKGKLEAETRDVEVKAGNIVQIDAAFDRETAGDEEKPAVVVGQSLPDIHVFPQDRWGNLLSVAPSPEIVDKIVLSASSRSDFEVVPGSVASSAICLEGYGAVVLKGARLRPKGGRAATPKFPADVKLSVQFGPARNEDSVERLEVRLNAGPACRLQPKGALAAAGSGPGPALVRGSTLDDFALRALDKDGNPADVQVVSGPVRIKLDGDGITIAPGCTSRPVPASGLLEYTGKLRVTGPFGGAGRVRAAIEGVEGSELVLPFTIEPRALRVALPEPLPDGFALLRAPVAPQPRPAPAPQAPAGPSSSSKRRRSDRGSSSAAVASPAAPAQLDEDSDSESEAAPVPADLEEDPEPVPPEVPAGAWVLRARDGAALRGAFVEVVDPADWGEVEAGLKGEAVDLSWDAGAGPRLQAGRARLPEIVPSALPGPAHGGPRLAHVTFAGLSATLAFLIRAEPAAALRPASAAPLAVRNREPAACALRLEGASGAAIPAAAFAGTARVTAELVDSLFALDIAQGGLACAAGAGADGALTVSGWSVRGSVGDGAGTALLRLRVEHSEPALPEAARTIDVPLTVAAGPAARLVWRPQEEGAAGAGAGPRGPLRLLNGACLPPIVVRAEDADGGLAASHAGLGSVTLAPGAELAHAGAPQQLRVPFNGGRALFTNLRFTAAAEHRGEGRIHELRFTHAPAPRSAVRRRVAPAPAPVPLPELEPVRVVVMPNPERPAALRLLQAGAPVPIPLEIRAVAGAKLDLSVEVLGETGEPTRLPAGAQALLRIRAASGSEARFEGLERAEEARGPAYAFEEGAAPIAAGEHVLFVSVEPSTSPLWGHGAPLEARLLVEAGPPRALEAMAALPGGARSVSTGTGQTLPPVTVRLVDAGGNVVRRPAGAAPLAVSCRIEAESGERVPELAAAPRELTAEGSAEFTGLLIGEGTSGAYALLFELQGGPDVTPARLPFTFLSAAEERAEAERRRALQEELVQLNEIIENQERAVRAARDQLTAAGQSEAAAEAAVRNLEMGLGNVSPQDVPGLVAGIQQRLHELRATPEGAVRGAAHFRRPNDPSRHDIDRFLAAERQSHFPGFLGLVCHLARVEDDRVAEALACFIGRRAQAAVFEYYDNVRRIRDQNSYPRLPLIPILSFTDDAFWRGRVEDAPQRRLLLPDPPSGARYLVNELVLDERSAAADLRRTLWFYLCRDTLLVDDPQQRDFIINTVWHGKIRSTIIVLPKRDGRGAVDVRTYSVTKRNEVMWGDQAQEEPRAAFASTRSLQQEIADAEGRLALAQGLQARREDLVQRAAAARGLRAALDEKSRALEALKGQRDGLHAKLKAGIRSRGPAAEVRDPRRSSADAASKRGRPEGPPADADVDGMPGPSNGKKSRH